MEKILGVVMPFRYNTKDMKHERLMKEGTDKQDFIKVKHFCFEKESQEN